LESDIALLTETIKSKTDQLDKSEFAQQKSAEMVKLAEAAVNEKLELVVLVKTLKVEVAELKSAVVEAVKMRDVAVAEPAEHLRNKTGLEEIHASLAEAHALLQIETEKLINENAQLVGHQNARQKIQYVAKIKSESDKLRQDKEALEREVRMLRSSKGRSGSVPDAMVSADVKATSGSNAREKLDQLTTSILGVAASDQENMAPARSRSVTRAHAMSIVKKPVSSAGLSEVEGNANAAAFPSFSSFAANANKGSLSGSNGVATRSVSRSRGLSFSSRAI